METRHRTFGAGAFPVWQELKVYPEAEMDSTMGMIQRDTNQPPYRRTVVGSVTLVFGVAGLEVDG